jgi:hypothetical protein
MTIVGVPLIGLESYTYDPQGAWWGGKVRTNMCIV